ncbi:MAG: penicillin-binding protein 1C [Sedimentisphaerales bacterium]|nr:penicillin-binding protein 1C [Sedimentisphaerales bacterium]
MKSKIKKLFKLMLKLAAVSVVLCIGVFILIWELFPFPIEHLDKWSVSPAVLDVKGRPLLSIVGSDDQWRIPVDMNEISPWLKLATIAVEDERFYNHFGVDLIAVMRATMQNLASGRIVSGASTLNMQLCRMMDNRPRSFKAKFIESFRAMQLNMLLDKDDILKLYLNTAPYGGNIRGVEAASLRYFWRHTKDLNLAQAALIAGLPQSPGRYRPDRNMEAAVKRQHIVLARMLKERMITKSQFEQAASGSIEICHQQTVQEAYHAAWYALSQRPEGGRTTIDLDIQKHVEQLAYEYLEQLPKDTELSIVVIDIAESAIISMVGSGNTSDIRDGQVNGALAKRSPGSTLKPFIYAAAFEAGRLNSDSTVYDIPISRAGWTPANFDKEFAGPIKVSEALQRSLNIPAILAAEEIGLARCCGTIQSAGISLPANSQSRGGLAIAVGGIEVSLLELTNAYATLGRDGIRKSPRIFTNQLTHESIALTGNVCRLISDILSSRQRCPAGMEAVASEDIPWFMWKTGTSSGRRDAWAVGHNRRYAIGVWIGRFRGTGRVDYVGAQAAEPLLAELFSLSELKALSEPPRAKPVLVNNPLPVPRELAQALKITSPSSGNTFLSYNGSVTVHASANREEGISWFLNGGLIENEMVSRLTLSAGKYELLCVDQKGQSSKIDFSVLNSFISD